MRLKPELGHYAADRTRPVFVAILHLADRQRLPVFHPIECGFEAQKRRADARLPAAVAALRTGRRLATWLCPWPDRAGGHWVRAAAQRGCPRFEQGLAAHQVVEFLFELFLVEQLATGRSVDLSAQFRDAILISELLIR